MKIKKSTKLLAITLATASIFSIGLTSQVSANYANFLKLSDKYNIFQNAVQEYTLVNDNENNPGNLKSILSSFKGTNAFEKVKNTNDFTKQFTKHFKTLNMKDKRYFFEYVNQTIIHAFAKSKDKGINIQFDKNVLINFIEDLINQKTDPSNLASSIHISADEYNTAMYEQFLKAIEQYKQFNPNFSESNGDTLNVNDVEVQSPNGNSINLNQISISTNAMKHVIVGSEVKNNDQFQGKQLQVGHTKYAKDGMKNVADKRLNKLKTVMNNSDSLVNFFTKTVGFEPNKYIEVSTPINDEGFYTIKYYPVNNSSYTVKGMFPESWEWQNIKSAMEKIISNDNCIYTSVEFGKDIAYFYDSGGKIPVFIVVDATNKRIISTFPMAREEFKQHVSNNFNGLINSNALRPTDRIRISKKNLLYIDADLMKKIKNKLNMEITEDNGFLTISPKN